MTASTVAPVASAPAPLVRVNWRVVLLVLVALQLVWRTWALSQAYFWQDDFIYVHRADAGLGLEYLFQDYSGHLMPLQFLLVWVVTALAPLSWPVAAGLVLVLQALTSLAVLRLVRTLVGDGAAAVVLLSLYLFNPLTFTASLWWASALQAVPLQLCTALVLTAWVRHLRGGARRDAVVVVGGTVLALVCWEKALLLPPLLVAATVLVGPQLAGTGAVELLRRSRAVLVTVVGVAIGYVVAYLLLVEQTGSGMPTASEIGQLLRLGIAETFIPALLGGWWSGEPAAPYLAPEPAFLLLLLVWQVVALLVVATVVLGRWPAVRAWLLLVGYLLADISLVAAARLDFAGVVVARDPRYTADAVLVAVLAGAGAVAAVRARAGAVVTPSRAVVVGGLAVAAVVNASLVSGYRTVERLPTDDGKVFVAGARAAGGLPGGVDLVDGPVPDRVVAPFFVDDAHVSVVVGALPGDIRFGVPSADLRMLDGFGTPRTIEVRPAATSPTRTGPCPWPVGSDRVRLPLDSRVGAGRWVVRVGYVSGSPTKGVLEVDDRRYDVDLLQGVQHLSVEVTGEVREVALGDLADGVRLCVSDVVVGAPWPRQDG